MAGKTGADAVYKSLHLICGTLKRYSVKLQAFIDAAVAANIITSSEGAAAKAFITASNVTCDIFEKLANYNSIPH